MMRRMILDCSRNYVSWTSARKTPSSLLTKIVKEYDSYAPKIFEKGLAEATFIEIADIKNRIKNVLEYYTIGRKPTQGEFMVNAYETLEKPQVVSDELLHQIQVLVTTLELVQNYFFFWDDFEDDGKIRCNKPCWHLLPNNNGLLAVNDACIMRSFIDELIRQNFVGKLRDDILSIFSKTFFISAMGQHCDTVVADSTDFDNFTIQRYDETNKCRSSFYSVKSPLLLALAFCNRLNEESYHLVDDICTDVGIMVQIHNDFIDYLNMDGSVTGKSSTDIQEGKCSWPAVAILQKCNPEQRRIFKENYSSWDPKKVDRIRELYEELNVSQLYRQEEKARYESFFRKVNKLPKRSVPSADFFYSIYDLLRHYTQDITSLMYDKH